MAFVFPKVFVFALFEFGFVILSQAVRGVWSIKVWFLFKNVSNILRLKNVRNKGTCYREPESLLETFDFGNLLGSLPKICKNVRYP